MKLEVLLVQFLILAFTGVLWWVARRDLASRPASPPLSPPAETADLEQLCATLETLVTRLSRRLDVVERQIAQGVEYAVPLAAQPTIAPEPAYVPELAHVAEAARMPEATRMEAELARIANGLARMEDGLAQRQMEPPPAALSAPSLSMPSVPMQSMASMQPMPTMEPMPAIEPMPSAEPVQEADPVPDPRYALVSAMLDEGVTDPIEIARHTGLGRGEVELIISLRERRAF